MTFADSLNVYVALEEVSMVTNVGYHTFLSNIEIRILYFLSQRVYRYNYIYPNIKEMLKNPINLNRQILSKVNRWKEWIVSPKLDGIRALLLVFNSAIYLLFEKQLELILDHGDFQNNMVFEVEIYNNGIYIYDIHFHD